MPPEGEQRGLHRSEAQPTRRLFRWRSQLEPTHDGHGVLIVFDALLRFPMTHVCSASRKVAVEVKGIALDSGLSCLNLYVL